MDLANRHIKLLKRLYHSEIPLSDFSGADRESIAFLGNCGFIRYSTEDIDSRNAPTIVCIQPSGQEINVYVNANKMNAVTAENPPANADNK